MRGIESLFSRAKNAASSVGDIAGDLAEKTRINMDISALENEQEQLYAFVGEAYYRSVTEQSDISIAKAAIEKITDNRCQIEELQNKLNDLRKVKICGQCDRENDADSSFCSGCGSKL
jgi:hypothetical protein